VHVDLWRAARRILRVRGIRALLLAILVGVTAVTSHSQGDNAKRACAGRLSCVGARLPAPITIAAGHGLGSVTFRVGRDGRVRRIPDTDGPLPRDAAWFPGTGTWYGIRHGHLVVGRGHEPLWRSHGQIAADQLGVIAAGRDAVAFQREHKLYLAPLRGDERPVAHRELPLGWTIGGLYTYRYQTRQLLLRSDAGALVKVIARRPLGSDYHVANGGLYFISRGVLMSASGTRVKRLASLKRLGLSAGPWLQPLGQLVELEDNHRLVVVRSDGTMFAWTRLPLSHGRPGNISSSLVVAPRAKAIAFTVAYDHTADPRAPGRSHGTETTYVLHPGAETAVPVHRENVQFAVCERGASLQWHRQWLLYSNTEGNLAVIDTTGARRAIELGGLVRGITGTRGGFGAYWSGQPTAL
jgi:hypothetical protein